MGIKLYYNTIKDLKPVQIRHQIYKKIFPNKKNIDLRKLGRISKAPEMKKYTIHIAELDESPKYLERFNVNNILENRIELLHEEHVIKPGKWQIEKAPHLWNYNLHYLEFLIPLAVGYGNTKDERYYLKWKEYMDDWIDNISNDSYEPYTISLRIPNGLICIEIMHDIITEDKDFYNKVNDSLYRQYRFLIQNRELSLLANHYLENIKTIVIGSMVWGEEKVFDKYFPIFEKEIKEQVLPDGFHFELSPMYHKIVLEDILRVYRVLTGCGKTEAASKLTDTLKCMGDAIASFEKNTNRTPLFNDAGDNVSKDSKSLVEAVEKYLNVSIDNNIKCFKNAGYYKLEKDNKLMIIDCGNIGPRYMSGHSHCDTLSFELFMNGKPVFVNSGTNQYQGKERSYFRSTKAHNTLTVDNREQSELWGEHRAARKISDIYASVKDESVESGFKSYLEDQFYRKFIWKNKNIIEIIEAVSVKDDKAHSFRSFWHIAPEYELKEKDNCICIIDKKSMGKIAELKFENVDEHMIHNNDELCRYAPEFGHITNNTVLEIITDFRRKSRRKIIIELYDLN